MEKKGMDFLKCITQLFLIFWSAMVFAQDDFPVTSFEMNSRMMKESLIGANNISVNHFKGVVTTTIPINNYKGRELDLPISISNTSTGVKVEQLAGSVGLNWNLNVGGKLSRIVNGSPDDAYPPPCTTERKKDFFNFNAMGINDYILFEDQQYDFSAQTIIDPLTEVVWGGNNNDWVITTRDGVKFYFYNSSVGNAKEVTTTNENITSPACIKTSSSVSAYMLTKLVSANGLDTYEFKYQEYIWTNPIANNGEGSAAVGATSPILNTGNYNIKQQLIKEIYHNGIKIIDFSYVSRNDLPTASSTNLGALASIRFYNFNAASIYKKVNFGYSYFGNGTQYHQLRLKLDDVTSYGINAQNPNGVAGDKYSFGYFQGANNAFPSLNSYGQDYLGLYNGYDSNTNLIMNRQFVYDKAILGTLNEIKYPGKGYTKLEYEQNKTHEKYSNALVLSADNIYTPTNPSGVIRNVDGFRVKSIANYLSDNVPSTKKEYKYLHGEMVDAVMNMHLYMYSSQPVRIDKMYTYGYLNGPSPVLYPKVFEVDVNPGVAGQHNGYISHNIKKFGDDASEDPDDGFEGYIYNQIFAQYDYTGPPYLSPYYGISNNNLDLFYSFFHNEYQSSDSRMVFSYNTRNIEALNIGQKAVYNNQGVMVSAERFRYNKIYYRTPSSYYPDSNQVASYIENYFTALGQYIKIDYPKPNQKIVKKVTHHYIPNEYLPVDYFHNDFLPHGKTDEFGHEDYQFLHPKLQNVMTGTTHSINGTTIKEFTVFAGYSTNYALLREMQYQSGTPLEKKIRYDYDTKGNRVSAVNVTPGTIADSQYESYLYGYNNRFVIAKLTGVKYSQITQARKDAIKTAEDAAVLSGNDDGLRTALNLLRSDFPNALITTYTYNPSYGVTSATDEKGYTLLTEYDIFGRVKMTKEKDVTGTVRILSENAYNTRPN